MCIRDRLGIDDYIPKPFSSDYLKSRIENLIRQRKVLQSAFLSKYGAQPKKEPLEAVAYPVSQIVPLDELFMQKLVGFMEENYSNPGLRVNDLAAVSYTHLDVYKRQLENTRYYVGIYFQTGTFETSQSIQTPCICYSKEFLYFQQD